MRWSDWLALNNLNEKLVHQNAMTILAAIVETSSYIASCHVHADEGRWLFPRCRACARSVVLSSSSFRTNHVLDTIGISVTGQAICSELRRLFALANHGAQVFFFWGISKSFVFQHQLSYLQSTPRILASGCSLWKSEDTKKLELKEFNTWSTSLKGSSRSGWESQR